MRYTYEDNPVGDIPLAEKASIVDAIFGGRNTEKEKNEGSASAGQETASPKNGSGMNPKVLLGILAVLFVILLTALVVSTGIAVNKKKKRKARQRRRAAAKRRGQRPRQ